MKKFNIVLCMFTLCFLVVAMSGCDKNKTQSKASSETDKKDNGKLNVVCTIFPEYDFLRQIGEDYVNLTMLLQPGAECHSFEPTPQNIKDIAASDLFVYVGGDSDEWVGDMLESVNTKETSVVTLMDMVDLAEEEVVEGMTPEKEETEAGEASDEVEYDEHVWTSPKNAEKIVTKLCEELCKLDPEHETEYQKNTEDYIAKLEALDGEFKEVTSNAKRKEIIVADRFPFRYFVDEYGLNYYAAFPGCSTDTEANAATVAFLVDKIKDDSIPVVFHIELSNEDMCNSICETTGAKAELLNAVHNISKEDFDNGVTYIDLMEHNVEVLKEALN